MSDGTFGSLRDRELSLLLYGQAFPPPGPGSLAPTQAVLGLSPNGTEGTQGDPDERGTDHA